MTFSNKWDEKEKKEKKFDDEMQEKLLEYMENLSTYFKNEFLSSKTDMAIWKAIGLAKTLLFISASILMIVIAIRLS